MKILQTIALILVLITFNSCRRKIREKKILIPDSYSGWVNIYFGQDSATNEYFEYKDDFYVIILNKNPCDFKIKQNVLPSGPYEWPNIYYFYSADTLYTCINRVFLFGSNGSGKQRNWHFYVTPFPEENFDVKYDEDSLALLRCK